MPTPRTILFCATGLFGTRGGIASANRNILAALVRLAGERALRVEVLVLHEPCPAEAAPHPGNPMEGVLLRGLAGSKLRFAAALCARLPRTCLLVFDHVRLALPLLALPGPLRPAFAICAHGSESWRRVRPDSIRLFRAADLVMANSEHTLARMRGRFDGFTGAACPLGLPPQFHLSATPPDEGAAAGAAPAISDAHGMPRPLGPRALLLVGRLDPAEREKGHRDLLAILPRLRRTHPDVQLVFAGGGADGPVLQHVARQLGVGEAVLFAGEVTDVRLADLYARAYAFVMPSRQEGFGLVYLEAMNFAKPCLACRDDGGAEIVVDGETGLLVDQPIDPDRLLAALDRLLADPARARRLGLAGWRRLHDRFTAEQHQGRVAALLDPLLR